MDLLVTGPPSSLPGRAETILGLGMRFAKILALSVPLALGLFGCATGLREPERAWSSSVTQDEFTDRKFKVVSTGSIYMGGRAYTQSGRLYPFVGEYDGKLVVGVRSGGTHRFPVGNVQLRIDDNPVWEISTTETPTDLYSRSSAATGSPMGGMMQAALSPFTVATGDKAKEILKQMLAGRVLKYRTMGYYSQPGVSGQFNLDPSFRDSLLEAGIALPK